MTKHPDLFAALAAPFAADEVKQILDRDGRVVLKQGKSINYITARTTMNRLDNVLGPENWWDRYVPGENSVLCELTIRLPDGSTLTKCDAGGYAGMADSGDDEKSGFSDSFKRAAVKFGVSRYLYRDGVPSFAAEQPRPSTPGIAEETHAPDDRRRRGADRPETGKQLFAWTRHTGHAEEIDLLKHLNAWAKPKSFPSRMVDWNPAQVAAGYAEATRKLASLQTQEVA